MSETPSSSETSTTDGDLGSPPAHLFPDLPDDIGLQCIARVPRFYHCDLSLVCKSWRSVIRSPIFFSTRSRLNCTEYSLYINLSIHGSSFNWFVLHQNPQNPRNLSRVPPIPSQAMGSAFAVLGPRIYVIGGSISRIPSSSVWIFDSRSNKWEIGPEMHVGRAFAAAGVVNGKIYVMGGCLVDLLDQSSNWAEVFDPAIGSWAPVPSPVEVRKKRMLWSAIMWEKIYAMSDQGGVVYYPGEASWRHVSFSIDLGWRGEAAIIDGILYFYDNSLRKIRGYDLKERIFKNLEGVELDWPPNHLCGTTMVNVGGRLYMVWRNGTGEQIDIWCVEVEVHKDGRGGLCGSIVWSQVILVIPSLSSSIIRCLVVEL